LVSVIVASIKCKAEKVAVLWYEESAIATNCNGLCQAWRSVGDGLMFLSYEMANRRISFAVRNKRIYTLLNEA
jgi:hypothetical protein